MHINTDELNLVLAYLLWYTYLSVFVSFLVASSPSCMTNLDSGMMQLAV